MIERFLYMGYHNNNFEIRKCDDIENLSVFVFRNMIFIYFETENIYFNPESIVSDTIPFPDGSKFVRMMNIFHYSKPVNREYWRRKIDNKTSLMRIAYLKPEKVSEYIFYHYKMQEEKHDKYDKFGSIFIHGNMLVMYNEYPEELAEIEIEPTIPENNLPDYNGNIIKDLSIPWDDFDGYWRECNKII